MLLALPSSTPTPLFPLFSRGMCRPHGLSASMPSDLSSSRSAPTQQRDDNELQGGMFRLRPCQAVRQCSLFSFRSHTHASPPSIRSSVFVAQLLRCFALEARLGGSSVHHSFGTSMLNLYLRMTLDPLCKFHQEDQSQLISDVFVPLHRPSEGLKQKLSHNRQKITI